MFSFNFGAEKCDVDDCSDERCEAAGRINPTSSFSFPVTCDYNLITLTENIKIKTLSRDSLVASLSVSEDQSIQSAENSHSDLLPGVYEGGLKIWECTYDLCQYMLQAQNIAITDKDILDLGCGAGILGILGKQLGAKTVDFQDYNSGVLKHLTIPNVALNLSSFTGVRFWSGDWGGLRNNHLYDIILTSETIYNSDNYPKLHNALKENLKPGGTVLLAAKLYYFGVGGSIGEFCDFIEKKNYFEYKNVFSSEEGVKRAILELRLKREDSDVEGIEPLS